MPTQEIPREGWSEFFRGFTCAHQGWLATIEVFDSDFGAQVEVRELPFEGITADLRNSDKVSICLMVGSTPDKHLTHTITEPTHVMIDQTKEGAKEALQIESAVENITLLRFRSPEFPDSVCDTIVE